MYQFFVFLLYRITLLRKENQNRFYNLVKEFIFSLFDEAFDKGSDYFLQSKISLFELDNKISKEFDKFIDEKIKILNNSFV